MGAIIGQNLIIIVKDCLLKMNNWLLSLFLSLSLSLSLFFFTESSVNLLTIINT